MCLSDFSRRSLLLSLWVAWLFQSHCSLIRDVTFGQFHQIENWNPGAGQGSLISLQNFPLQQIKKIKDALKNNESQQLWVDPAVPFHLDFFICLKKRTYIPTTMNTSETGTLVFQRLWGYSARKEVKSTSMENLVLVCCPVLPWVSSPWSEELLLLFRFRKFFVKWGKTWKT